MIVKALAERLAHQSGLTAVLRRHRRGVLVLGYHNVVADGRVPTGDLSLHMARSAFASQLDLLRDTCHVVPLAVALRGSSPASGRPTVVITFDDCYRGALSHGVSELALRGLPAHFFVAPGRLNRHAFWWDLLSEGRSGLADHDRAQGLEVWSGRDEAILEWARSTGRPLCALPEDFTTGTRDEIGEAVGTGLVTLGSHSWSHPAMSRVSAAVAREELQQSRAWLGQWGKEGLPVISWPYGLVNDTVAQAALSVGYEAGFRVDGGWMVSRQSPLTLPRWNVPAGISIDGFGLRLAGLLCR